MDLTGDAIRTEHHFYVDESTKRSTWIHPYDDPEFLRSLPDTHPANPNSAQAQAMHKRAEEEAAMDRKMQDDQDGSRSADAGSQETAGSDGSHLSGHEHRNWIQRQKDKLVGTPEERAKAKAEKRRVQEERRKQMQVGRCCDERLALADGSRVGDAGAVPEEEERVDPTADE